MRGLTRDEIQRVIRDVLPAIKVEATMALSRRAYAPRRDHRQDVEDFAHDVLVHLLADDGRVLKLWDPKRGPLQHFVRLITRQRVSRALQGHRGNPWGDEATEAATLESLAGADPSDRVLESREELRGVLEQLRAYLDDRGLLLFQRIYVEQAAIVDVAAELAMSREAVDAWNSRMRKYVRKVVASRPARKP